MRTKEELERHFIPPYYPTTVLDEGYCGELNKQAVDATYYQRRLYRHRRESSIADIQAHSELAFTGAVAMSNTLEYTDPEELVHITEPRISAAAETVRDAITLFKSEGKEQSKIALELRICDSLLAPLILYKSMCMYGDSSYARNKRQSLLYVGQHRLLKLGADIFESGSKEGPIDANKRGTLHLLSTVALLNSQGHPDRMALPTLAADDHKRATDMTYVQLENGNPTVQYAQTKIVRNGSQGMHPPHQALITSRLIGNSETNRKVTWRTLGILLERQFEPPVARERIAYIDKRRRNVRSSIKAESVSFDLLP